MAEDPKIDVKLDHSSWAAGFTAGLSGNPEWAPPGVDAISFYSGFIEGKAERQKPNSSPVSSSPNDSLLVPPRISMNNHPDKVEIKLSNESLTLESGSFTISAEEQRLLIILMITNAREMGDEEQNIANRFLNTLLKKPSQENTWLDQTLH